MPKTPVFCRALPREVSLAGQFCPIDTNFRTWVLLTLVLESPALSAEEKSAALLSVFSQPPQDTAAALTALAEFYCGGNGAKKGQAKGSSTERLFSFAEDEALLSAAFLSVYGLDLYTLPYLHWWQFLFLLEGLPADCALKQKIALRGLDLSSVQDPLRRKELAAAQAQVALAQPINDNHIAAQFWTEGGTCNG